MTPMSPDDAPPRRAHATMREVAALAGVGLKTVSRVINDEPNVRPETIERVLSAARLLDYRLDVNAGNLRRTDRRVRTIGLVVGNVANPFSGALHRGVEDVAHGRDTAVFASSLDDDASREARVVGEMLRRRVDGMILTTVRPDQSYLTREQERGTALVFVDRKPSGILADSVVANNAEAAEMATAHLLQRGHRNVGYIGDRPELWTASERHRGFVQACRTAGLATSDLPIIEDLHDEESSYLATRQMLAAPEPPTAIFSSQNLVTIGAIRALRDLGLRRSVALIGFDDIPLGDVLDPGITVVAQDPYRMGSIAANRIFSRLDRTADELLTAVVPATLIPRGSGEIPPPQLL